MRESELQDLIRLALGRRTDVVMWRNNVGVLETDSGHHVRYGLAKGSADLVGIVRMDNGVGRFFALEVKTPTGRVHDDQERWLQLVRSRGGYGAVVRSVDDAMAAVEAAKRTEAAGGGE